MAYYVAWLPTASAYCPESFGYCDFALGAFGIETPLVSHGHGGLLIGMFASAAARPASPCASARCLVPRNRNSKATRAARTVKGLVRPTQVATLAANVGPDYSRSR